MKSQVIPMSREEMHALMQEVEQKDEFDYMLFLVLKTTGRRLGELYGVEELLDDGVIVVGKKRIYVNGKPYRIDRTMKKYKKTGNLIYGVQVKDVDLDKGIMKVWVLKRRSYMQDETILLPEVVRLISAYIRKNRLKLDDYLFRKEGRGFRQIENRVKIYAKKAGIKHNVVVHNFRHYFITELKRKGWTDDKIKKLTGHKLISSLSSYDHIVASDLKEEALEDLKSL